MKTKSYHFSLGNSVTGPVGLRARIEATSEKEAVEKLKAQLGTEQLVAPSDFDYAPGRVDYIRVYFNPEAVTDAAIASVDELQS